MMDKIREKLRQFMTGRYGMDQMNRFLLYAVMAVILINIFVRSGILEVLEIAGLVYLYFRMLSKNVDRRYQENQVFVRRTFKMTEGVNRWKFRMQEGRKFHIYKCPGCGQKVRVPRGRGKISIHCPKCGGDFVKRS